MATATAMPYHNHCHVYAQELFPGQHNLPVVNETGQSDARGALFAPIG
jgi:hypothetical protein